MTNDCPYDVEWCDRDRRWCGECSADRIDYVMDVDVLGEKCKLKIKITYEDTNND